MSWYSIFSGKKGILVGAAFLVLSPVVRAGDRVHSSARPISRSQTVSVAAVHLAVQPVTVSLLVPALQQPTKEPVYVTLRGPDGQLQRFPVEGGRSAIYYRQTILRPGESVTIQWTPAK
jgi:hypothetical protein